MIDAITLGQAVARTATACHTEARRSIAQSEPISAITSEQGTTTNRR